MLDEAVRHQSPLRGRDRRRGRNRQDDVARPPRRLRADRGGAGAERALLRVRAGRAVRAADRRARRPSRPARPARRAGRRRLAATAAAPAPHPISRPSAGRSRRWPATPGRPWSATSCTAPCARCSRRSPPRAGSRWCSTTCTGPTRPRSRWSPRSCAARRRGCCSRSRTGIARPTPRWTPSCAARPTRARRAGLTLGPLDARRGVPAARPARRRRELRRLYAESGGNPFHLMQLARTESGRGHPRERSRARRDPRGRARGGAQRDHAARRRRARVAGRRGDRRRPVRDRLRRRGRRARARRSRWRRWTCSSPPTSCAAPKTCAASASGTRSCAARCTRRSGRPAAGRRTRAPRPGWSATARDRSRSPITSSSPPRAVTARPSPCSAGRGRGRRARRRRRRCTGSPSARSLARGPQECELLGPLARALAGAGRFADARRVLLELLGPLPETPRADGLIAACAMMDRLLGDHDGARQRLRTALVGADARAAVALNLSSPRTRRCVGTRWRCARARARRWRAPSTRCRRRRRPPRSRWPPTRSRSTRRRGRCGRRGDGGDRGARRRAARHPAGDAAVRRLGAVLRRRVRERAGALRARHGDRPPRRQRGARAGAGGRRGARPARPRAHHRGARRADGAVEDARPLGSAQSLVWALYAQATVLEAGGDPPPRCARATRPSR